METNIRYPAPVALAEVFLWQVFLSEKWNHLFVGPGSAGLQVLPQQLSFVPNKRKWGRGLSNDLFTVIYEEGSFSRVTVGMRANREDERPGLLWPGTVKFEVLIFSKDLVSELGTEKIVTEPITVWRK
jgi:hypothetical protein